MNKNNVPLNKRLKHEWNELDIACKAVLIIGVFLLIQLICAIFIPDFHSQPTINAIFQTSLSSIFGYILGMNIPHEKKHLRQKQILKHKSQTLKHQFKI